jgi:hypothetical protein
MSRVFSAILLLGLLSETTNGSFMYFDGNKDDYMAATSGYALIAHEDFSGWAVGIELSNQIPNCTFSGSATVQGPYLWVREGIHDPCPPEEYFPDHRGIPLENGGYFEIDFAQPVAAFGLIHYDDAFAAKITLQVVGGTEDLTSWTPAGEMESPPNNTSGRFWGVVAGNNVITQARIANPGNGDAWGFDDFYVSVVPEPSTLALLGVGAISILGYARRRGRG